MSQPKRTYYVPKQSATIGHHIPFGQGYGVHHGQRPGAGQNNGHVNAKHANGFMTNQIGEEVDFYIEEMSVDFAMGGKSAQSRRVREFFPRNFVQPSLMITGTAPSSYEFNRLAAFVRGTHLYAVSGRELRAAGVAYRTVKDKTGITPLNTVRLHIESGGRNTRRNHKGRHRPWIVEGYVKNMQAGAEKENHAPQFSFEFVVANTISGAIYKDSAVQARRILPWMDIFVGRSRHAFIEAPSPKAPDFQPGDSGPSQVDRPGDGAADYDKGDLPG